jgi:hypothetical protein
LVKEEVGGEEDALYRRVENGESGIDREGD